MSTAQAQERRAAAQRAVEANPAWYHTLELAPGVVTPGRIDLRETAAKLLPRDLSGLRALDVGTFDGFWAYELEKRGADTVAIDVDSLEASEWPPVSREALSRDVQAGGHELGRGFRLASELLGSHVKRVVCSVYDLTPEAIGGPVDLVFLGALLVHLRDPVKALERIRGALVPGGRLLQLERYWLGGTLRHPRTPIARIDTLNTPFDWWVANESTLRTWLRTAGLTDIEGRGLHRPPQRVMSGWFRGLSSRRPPAP